MVPGSLQLSALPSPPSAVPLDAVAGNLTVTAKLFLIHTTYTLVPQGDLGDLLVKPDSALAYGADSGNQEYTDTCSMSVSELFGNLGWNGCTHGGLLYDSGVGSQVVSWVQSWIGTNTCIDQATAKKLFLAAPVNGIQGNEQVEQVSCPVPGLGRGHDRQPSRRRRFRSIPPSQRVMGICHELRLLLDVLLAAESARCPSVDAGPVPSREHFTDIVASHDHDRGPQCQLLRPSAGRCCSHLRGSDGRSRWSINAHRIRLHWWLRGCECRHQHEWRLWLHPVLPIIRINLDGPLGWQRSSSDWSTERRLCGTQHSVGERPPGPIHLLLTYIRQRN